MIQVIQVIQVIQEFGTNEIDFAIFGKEKKLAMNGEKLTRRAVVVFTAVIMAGSAAALSSKSKSKRTAPANPQTGARPLRGSDTKEGASQAAKSARVLSEIMAKPDKAIPRDLLGKAECVAVFPRVLKAGFIVGAQGGRGVASCRTSSGWSAPAYFELKGGSIGLQAGGQATDFVLLFMNEGGMQSLLSDRFELGGEASIAAGPVGRTTAATTDIKMDAQILSYSRSKGLFGGVSLKGSVISPDKSDMEGTYGDGVTAETVLKAGQNRAPTEVRVFPRTLANYSTRKKK